MQNMWIHSFTMIQWIRHIISDLAGSYDVEIDQDLVNLFVKWICESEGPKKDMIYIPNLLKKYQSTPGVESTDSILDEFMAQEAI